MSIIVRNVCMMIPQTEVRATQVLVAVNATLV